MPYRVIIQRPKAQIAVRARIRARNPAASPPRRRLAEDDRDRAEKSSQPARIRARAQANSEPATAPVTMADKKPAGPPEAVVNAAAGCATRRRTRNRTQRRRSLPQNQPQRSQQRSLGGPPRRPPSSSATTRGLASLRKVPRKDLGPRASPRARRPAATSGPAAARGAAGA